MQNNPQKWEKEYKKKGIPSSFNDEFSQALNFLFEFLDSKQTNYSKLVAADLGTGRGRNAFALAKKGFAKVYAVDFVQSLIEEVKSKIKASKLSSKVIPIYHDLTKPWPFETESIDVIADIFCFKHQTHLSFQEFYKKELVRTLRKNGILLISLAGLDDGYYGSLNKIRLKEGIYKITDPETNVESLLFSKESLISEFTQFSLEAFAQNRKFGPMHGRNYRRSTLKFILRKN